MSPVRADEISPGAVIFQEVPAGLWEVLEVQPTHIRRSGQRVRVLVRWIPGSSQFPPPAGRRRSVYVVAPDHLFLIQPDPTPDRSGTTR